MYRTTLFFFKIGFFLLSIAIAVTSFMFFYYGQELPEYDDLSNYQPRSITRFYTIDGKLIEEYAKENRVFVPISTVPQSLKEAFISSEDKSFYEHQGIDFLGLARAAIFNISNILQGKRLGGASTITQQVIKNFLLSSERSFSRKIKEAILAYRISKFFSKEHVLELYLNQIYLGKGAYGVAAAAQVYFNKSVDELTLPESAFLAALPKAPSTFNPEKYYERAKARRDYVISRMLEDGYIGEESAQKAIDTPIETKKRDKTYTITADYYAEKVREEIIAKFGQDFFYNGGLTVVTSMKSEYQTALDNSLKLGLRKYDISKGFRGAITNIDVADWQNDLKAVKTNLPLLEYEIAVVLGMDLANANIGLKNGLISTIPLNELKWAKNKVKEPSDILTVGDVVVVEKIDDYYALKQIPEVNGAAMVMSPITGQVYAMAGGYDFKTNKFNRATQAIRQPGSLTKPFAYIAAMEKGLDPETIIEDAPIELEQGPGLPLWKPKNFGDDFLGPIPMAEGLIKSRNPVTVRVAQYAGIDYVADTINKFGINNNPPHLWSMVLGALESTLEKVLTAFAVFANQGHKINPQYIEYIKDGNGKIIYRRETSGLCINCTNDDIPDIKPFIFPKIISDKIYYHANLLFQEAAKRGTARRLQPVNKIIGAKTGTTNNSMDTWVVAFTPNLIVGGYVGYDQPKPMGKYATGATVALPIVLDFMQKAVAHIPSVDFVFNPDIVGKPFTPEEDNFTIEPKKNYQNLHNNELY